MSANFHLSSLPDLMQCGHLPQTPSIEVTNEGKCTYHFTCWLGIQTHAQVTGILLTKPLPQPSTVFQLR